TIPPRANTLSTTLTFTIILRKSRRSHDSQVQMVGDDRTGPLVMGQRRLFETVYCGDPAMRCSDPWTTAPPHPKPPPTSPSPPQIPPPHHTNSAPAHSHLSHAGCHRDSPSA